MAVTLGHVPDDAVADEHEDDVQLGHFFAYVSKELEDEDAFEGLFQTLLLIIAFVVFSTGFLLHSEVTEAGLLRSLPTSSNGYAKSKSRELGSLYNSVPQGIFSFCTVYYTL